MRDKISQIRGLLDSLESEAAVAEDAAAARTYSGLELPDIIRDVVDLLLPNLKPYEAAFFLYALRHSVVENGTCYIRMSTRGLQSGIVRSAYADTQSGGADVVSSSRAVPTLTES